MELNADFTRRAAVHAARTEWVPSPSPGVDRRMLDRVGDEVARATSIVRFAPGSAFAPHTHGGGEEFLVLDGVFTDESGDFATGTYARNPPTSRHTPSSTPGCTLFVKLWQFDPGDRTQLRVDTTGGAYMPDPGRPGFEILPLHADPREIVQMERWAPGATVELDSPGGLEILVVEGSLTERGEEFTRLSWLRLPVGVSSNAVAGAEGARLWIKRGHLASGISAPTKAA
jgi:ChrR Cupin-like domain